MSEYTLHHGDCLDILPTLEAASVDCVIADIPYYGVVSDDWDNQWATIEDFQAWVNAWAVELKRIVKSNGSIYIFGDAKMSAYVQTILDRHFLLLNNITWYKTNNLPIKNVYSLRSWAPMTERIMFYEQRGADRISMDAAGYDSACQSLLCKIYKIGDLCRIHGVSRSQIAELIKSDYKNIDSAKAQASNWILGKNIPNRVDFDRLKTIIPIAGEYEDLRREYEDLRREYEDLRREYEDLRRTWNTDGNTLDVIIGPIVSGTDNTAHPTTKPLWLLHRLIKASTNKGDTILDFTMGSGSCGVECVPMGRNFIGIDNGHCEKEGLYYGWRWVDVAHERIANAAGEFTPTAKEKASAQMSIFGGDDA